MPSGPRAPCAGAAQTCAAALPNATTALLALWGQRYSAAACSSCASANATRGPPGRRQWRSRCTRPSSTRRRPSARRPPGRGLATSMACRTSKPCFERRMRAAQRARVASLAAGMAVSRAAAVPCAGSQAVAWRACYLSSRSALAAAASSYAARPPRASAWRAQSRRAGW